MELGRISVSLSLGQPRHLSHPYSGKLKAHSLHCVRETLTASPSHCLVNCVRENVDVLFFFCFLIFLSDFFSECQSLYSRGTLVTFCFYPTLYISLTFSSFLLIFFEEEKTNLRGRERSRHARTRYRAWEPHVSSRDLLFRGLYFSFHLGIKYLVRDTISP